MTVVAKFVVLILLVNELILGLKTGLGFLLWFILNLVASFQIIKLELDRFWVFINIFPFENCLYFY